MEWFDKCCRLIIQDNAKEVYDPLGGAWFPLEITGETFSKIGHITPTAWAMDGFQNIVLRGLGTIIALLPAAILVAFASAFFC